MSLRDLMGMAEASVCDECWSWARLVAGAAAAADGGSGDEMPAGVAAFSEKMKSSIFIGSVLLTACSDDFRS